MLNNGELERLFSAMRVCRVTSLEVKNKEQSLRLVLPAPVAPSTQLMQAAARIEAIPKVLQVSANSPSIGTFLRRGVDDGLPLLEAGMRVTTGEILGYVCKGPVRVIVEAPDNGVINEDGPDDGAVLGFGDAVFNLDITL